MCEEPELTLASPPQRTTELTSMSTPESSALRTSKPVLKKNLVTQSLETRTQGVRKASQNQVGLWRRWQPFAGGPGRRELTFVWFLFFEVVVTSALDSPA